MSNFCTTGAMIYYALTIQPTPADKVEVIQCAPTLSQCYTGLNAAKAVASGYGDVISTPPEIKCVKEGGRHPRRPQ